MYSGTCFTYFEDFCTAVHCIQVFETITLIIKVCCNKCLCLSVFTCVEEVTFFPMSVIQIFCEQDYAKSCGAICMKPFRIMDYCDEKNL